MQTGYDTYFGDTMTAADRLSGLGKRARSQGLLSWLFGRRPVSGLNAGTGRRLTRAESREKTKDWPKAGEIFKTTNMAGDNYPPGFDKHLLD